MYGVIWTQHVTMDANDGFIMVMSDLTMPRIADQVGIEDSDSKHTKRDETKSKNSRSGHCRTSKEFCGYLIS